MFLIGVRDRAFIGDDRGGAGSADVGGGFGISRCPHFTNFLFLLCDCTNNESLP